MKKIGYKIFLSTILGISLLSNSALTQDKDEIEIKQQVEKYQDYCHNKAYPKEKYDKIIALIDGQMKQAEQIYSQCIKEIILNKLEENFPQQSTSKMKEGIEEISNGTLKFYWYLYNSQDNGLIGELQNDAAQACMLDKILEDIVHYLTIYGRPSRV